MKMNQKDSNHLERKKVEKCVLNPLKDYRMNKLSHEVDIVYMLK